MAATDVVIIGGGPVGLGLAIDLGQRGIDVVLLERSEKLHRIPKGQNLTQRTGEHFRAWGVAEEMEAARPIPAAYGTAGVVTYKSLLSPYAYRWQARSDVAAYYAARNIRLPQYDTERVLRARAAELPTVDLRLGAMATDCNTTGELAQLSITDADRMASDLTAKFVVGCDGSHSMVREAAGITQSFGQNRHRMLLAVVRSRELEGLLARFPEASFFSCVHPDHDGFWHFLGRVDLEPTWFFHCPVADNITAETLDLAALLTETVGQPFTFETNYVGFWDLRVAIADTYRAGSVFIAGDAAHSHPPYGGYGVNLGFEDARNLAWKLNAALKGWAGEELLDSYSVERQPVFVSTARDFIEYMIEDDRAFLGAFNPNLDKAAFEEAWNQRAVSAPRGVDHFVPHYGGSPIVLDGDGTTGALGHHRHRADPGYHLSPQGGIFDRLGGDFSLITVGEGNGAAAAFKDAAAQLNIPLTVHQVARTGETGRWETQMLLVRPDHFIAWTGSPGSGSHGSGDTISILRRAVGYPS